MKRARRYAARALYVAIYVVLTAIAIVIPYSGLVMTPVALVAFKYMDSNKVVPMT